MKDEVRILELKLVVARKVHKIELIKEEIALYESKIIEEEAL